MEEIIVNGFELMALNREFAELLKKHEDDTEVQGESKESFESIKADTMSDPNFTDEDKADMVSYYAAIWNAWDELCDKHDGLRESNLSWWAGAEWTDYPNNAWDIYVGTGDELD